MTPLRYQDFLLQRGVDRLIRHLCGIVHGGGGVRAVGWAAAESDFTPNLQFVADIGSGFQAIETVPQAQGSENLTNSDFLGGFYTEADEAQVPLMGAPGLALLGVGLVGAPLVAARKRRTRNA